MEEQLKALLEEHGVDRVIVYAEKTSILQNAFTTCLFMNTQKKQIEARGVAICSVSDIYKKGKGKSKAFGRAMKALLRKENDFKINPENRSAYSVKKDLKLKNAESIKKLEDEIIPELKKVYGVDHISINLINSHKNAKTFTFDLPANYPIILANKLYKYKSEYRPNPSGAFETKLIQRL